MPLQKANELLEKLSLNPVKNTANAYEFLKRPEISYKDIVRIIGENNEVANYMSENIETEIKYEGYIKRQLEQIAAVAKRENTIIPEEFLYDDLHGLRLEAREKLGKIRPHSVGQASRIPGVSPSDISQLTLALAVYFKAKPDC